MTLSEQIDAMRQRMIETHTRDLAAAEALGRFLQEKDVALMQTLHAVLADDERRRSDIAQVLHKLAMRVGTVPPFSAQQIEGGDMPRIARHPDPQTYAQTPPPPPKLGAVRGGRVA